MSPFCHYYILLAPSSINKTNLHTYLIMQQIMSREVLTFCAVRSKQIAVETVLLLYFYFILYKETKIEFER